MGKYASKTRVSVEQSKREVMDLLRRYGANGAGFYDRRDLALVQFEMGTRRVSITISLPDPQAKEFTMSRHKNRYARYAVDKETAHRRWKQACRQRWRALLLILKAKLEAIDAEISTFDEEFLPFLVLPDGQTIGQKLVPQLKQLQSGERALPRLVEATGAA